MSAPLYNNNAAPDTCEDTGNKGLWFDRFYDQYDTGWKVLKPKTNDEKKGNAHWLIKHFHNKKVGNDDQLSSHNTQQQYLAKGLQGQSHIYTANWHFVTGMGNPHPVENGFAWHPTLGVPYLTGAAVKGIVRSYIENYLDDTEDNKKALLFNWFGSEDKDPDKSKDSQTGNIIFFDALPVESVTLTVDIMTPHMGDWYQKGAESPNIPETVPADWHDPVPVTFLACKNISLQFSYALRQYPQNSEYQPEKIDLDDIKKVLSAALEYFGAGGKTATGYGQFYNQDDQDKKQAQQDKIKKEEAQETWENANLKQINARGGLFLEATSNGKTARTNWEMIKPDIDTLNLSNSQLKKLKKAGISKTIKVEKIGNKYSILSIQDA